MEWFNALMTSVKDFRDFVFRPLFLFTFAILALILLILPKSFLTWLGPAALIEQHRAGISIAMIVLFAVGIIRTLDVYFFPWRRQRKQQERERESLQSRLETLSRYELSILAYCLSRNRKTFFVLDQGRNQFENAVRSLTTRGFFKQGPLAIQGYSFDITDEYWPLFQYFKEDIRERSEAVNPDWEQKFEFYDGYQKAFGFGQAETSVQRKEIGSISESKPTEFTYTLYTKDVFYEVIWKWRYRFEFGQKPLDLTPHCPNCERGLVPDMLEGEGIFFDPNEGQRYKYVSCSVHRKDYDIPVDERGDYVAVIASIMNNIETGKWKEIIDRQEDRIRMTERKE